VAHALQDALRPFGRRRRVEFGRDVVQGALMAGRICNSSPTARKSDKSLTVPNSVSAPRSNCETSRELTPAAAAASRCVRRLVMRARLNCSDRSLRFEIHITNSPP
jgi:hypothetical protein